MAVVTITARIPPFAKVGTAIDVTVASIGDAKSLNGAILLQTPLVGADRKVYALAQGPLSVGGFSAGTGGGGGASVQKNHPTVAQIVNGATVVKEIHTDRARQFVGAAVARTDFTSASLIATAINQKFPGSSQALDKSSIRVRIPDGLEGPPVDFIARLEAIEVMPDTPARIIINERTGTIVATSRVKISACAISHGNLTITIASSLEVSQPNAFSQTGTTIVAPRADTKVTEPKTTMVALPNCNCGKVASTLNALGVTPRDTITIFQAMKQAGALQAGYPQQMKILIAHVRQHSPQLAQNPHLRKAKRSEVSRQFELCCCARFCGEKCHPSRYGGIPANTFIRTSARRSSPLHQQIEVSAWRAIKTA